MICKFIKHDIFTLFYTIVKYMKSDKKNYSSKINLILIKKIGKIVLNKTYNEKVIK